MLKNQLPRLFRQDASNHQMAFRVWITLKNMFKQALFKKFLFLWLMGYLVEPAYSRENNDSYELFKHIRLGVDFGIGIPYGFGEVEQAPQERSSNPGLSTSTGPAFKTNSNNAQLGLNLGYDFYGHTHYRHSKWIPEIGLSYGFTRRFELLADSVGLEEKYLHIPLMLNYLSFDESKAYKEASWGAGIGYEYPILLSLVYKDADGSNILSSYNQQVQASNGHIFTLPNPRGAVLLHTFLYIMDGMHVGLKIRLPIEEAAGVGQEKQEIHQLSEEFIHLARFMSGSFVEFYIGLDILSALNLTDL